MPASNATSLNYCVSFLKREYPSTRLVDLEQLAREVFGTATETVQITTVSSEGGQTGGQVTFDKIILGTAIEKLIAQYIATAAGETSQGGSRAVFSDFSKNWSCT